MDRPLKKIELLLLDVDGVLTDGKITYADSGEQIKSFDCKDGLGIRLLMDYGVKVGLVTARVSMALRHRCENLGLDLIFDGIKDKALALDRISAQTGIDTAAIGFMGDDLIDLPAMTRAGFSFAPCDAAPEVRDRARFVCQAKGGQGAVREVCEAILRDRGDWDKAVASFLK